MDYKCLIIDDEPLAHNILERYINDTENLVLSGKCYNAQEAFMALKNTPIDIIFLDIKMPKLNGIHFLEALEDKPVTILTTAYRDYAVEGFDLGVMDYLVKPIDFDRFTRAILRAMEFLYLKKLDNNIEEQPDETQLKDHLVIKSNGKTYIVPFAHITHLQGLKDYTILYTNEKKHVIKGYIKIVETMLPENMFLRVHKSFIVAKDKIKVIHHNKIEFDAYQIPIGRSFKKDIVEKM
jgi:DNA-binding LytR/AlgR family response regulator